MGCVNGAHLDDLNVVFGLVGIAQASAVLIAVAVASFSILTILLTSSQSLRDLVWTLL